MQYVAKILHRNHISERLIETPD